MKDEEGNIIPKLAEDFDKVGVHIKDANGNLNSTYDIIRQLSKVWGTLSADEQLNLLEKGAGKMRSNVLAAMITNFGEAEKTLKDSFNSANSAINEQNAYLNSLQAKTRIFKESINGIYQKIISSEGLKDFVDSGISIVNTLDKVIDKFGALPLAITTATTALMAFNSKAQIINFTPKFDADGVMSINMGGIINGVKKSMEEFSKSYAKMLNQQMLTSNVMNPTLFTRISASMKALTTTTIAQTVATGALKVATFALNAAIGLGIGLLISFAVEGIMKVINSSKKATETLKELSSQMQSVNSNSNLIEQYKEITRQIAENTKLGKDNVELKEKQIEMQKQLAQAFPEAIDGYTGENEAIVKNIENIEKLNEAKKNQILATAGNSYNDLYSKLTEGKVQVTHSRTEGDFEQKIPSLIEKYKQLSEARDNALAGGDQKSASKFAKQLEPILTDIEEFNKASIQLHSIGMKNAEVFDFQTGEMKKYSNVLSSNTNQIKDNTNAKENNIKSTRSFADITKDLMKNISDSKKEISSINEVLDRYHKSNEWDLETILTLANQGYPQLISMLGDNKKLEEELIKIKGDKVKATQDSLNKEIQLEVAYINELMKGYNFDVTAFTNAQEAKNAATKSGINKRILMYRDEAEAALKVAEATSGIMQDNALRGAMRSGLLASAENAKLTNVSTAIDDYFTLKQLSVNVGKYLGSVGSKSSDGKSSSKDATDEAEKARDEAYQAIEDINSKLTDAIKQQVEEEKKALDERLNNYKKFIDDKLKALDDEYTQEDRQRKLAEENKKKQELETQRNELMLDTSDEANSRRNDILKQIEEQQKVIDDLNRDYNREDRKANLEAQLTEFEKQIEEQQKAIDEKYTDSEIAKMANNGLHGALIQIGDKTMTAKQLLIDAMQKSGEAFEATGQKLQTELIDRLEKVIKLTNSMDGNGNISSNKAQEILGSHANGAKIYQQGLYELHPNEWVVNQEQGNILDKIVKNDLSFLKKYMPKIPSVSPIGMGNNVTLNFDALIGNVQGSVDDNALVKLKDFMKIEIPKLVAEAQVNNFKRKGFYNPSFG